MDKKILIGTDELTMVIFCDLSDLKDEEEWSDIAESTIDYFARILKFEKVFGEKMDMDASPPAGYSIAYTFGNNPFYFAIAYHPTNPNMGIICKFSAYSWSEYCSKWFDIFNRKMDIKKFADVTNVDGYISRFSRVDFTIDYHNFETTVDKLYSSINKGEIEIRNHKGIKNNSKTNGFFQDEFQTFYIGSRKKNSRLFLRVYDKKVEQLENPTFRYEEALNVESWVRFEGVFKSKYAHDITDMLREEVDDSEDSLMAFIAGKLLEKYQFFNVMEDKQIEFTSELVKIYDKRNTEYSHLRIENPRNSDLMQSINYIVLNSGLMTLIHKIKNVFGEKEVNEFFEYLLGYYLNNYKPNKDVELWIDKNRSSVMKGELEKIFNQIKKHK
ncbi:hypothetical protein AKUH3B209X_11680 [Apilactobacillus kunkeei]|nr:replication initiation factor domain-containing protein [Staphylococcus epidermidis]MCT6858823.1 replication initiation factor domain-containing protein [Apilactobacillus sp.]CAI2629995.1 hypothetical protein AKUH3B207X_11150 [Apilactobacillus kunkeei]CAI2632875.1 hypothetical protein AKUH4B203M_11200 [Apilactobacillus kunkeei]CAI2633193.1 hypothetical protein AKUH4B205J_11360 [Apilactobacillus kunkeei]